MDTSKWTPVLLVLLVAALAFKLWYTPSHSKFYQRGIKYYDNKEFEAASTEFLKAISEAKESDDTGASAIVLDSYLMAGEILDQRLGRSQRAVKLYQEMISAYTHAKESIEARKRMAGIYLDKLDKPDEAIAIYKKLLEIWTGDPQVAGLELKILDIYMQQHQFEQVVLDGEEFLSNDDLANSPSSPAIHFIIADATFYLGHHNEARQIYLEIEQNYPGSYHAHLARFEIGNCELKLGLLEDALSSYKKALPHYPSPLVVKSRIKDVRIRLADKNDQQSLPMWARKNKNTKTKIAPPIINPFPEDSRQYRPVKTEAAATKPKPKATPKPEPVTKKPDTTPKAKPLIEKPDTSLEETPALVKPKQPTAGQSTTEQPTTEQPTTEQPTTEQPKPSTPKKADTKEKAPSRMPEALAPSH